MSLSRTWIILFACAALQAAEKSYDVVVVGAGSGGTAAAIQAARQGRSVALVEETDWIGGQMTSAAVPTMDEGWANRDSGLYFDFISRVRAHYAKLGKSVGTCYWSAKSNCFEPKVGQQILYDMIVEARKSGTLDVLLRQQVVRVLSSGDTVTGIVTKEGATLYSKVLIDATEYGDVLPLTPARYRIGHSIGASADPAGCVQWITYTAVVKKYQQGVPPELVLPHAPPGYTDELRRTFYRSLRRDGNPTDRLLPITWPVHNAYRGLPDSTNPANYDSTQAASITKTVLNWFNDFPVTIGALERPNRKRLFCEAKLKTLQMMYYMQHDLGESLWAVANDEGYDTPYNREENLCDNIPAEFKAIERQFPVMPYIRESRRLVGAHTLTAIDVRREGTPPLAVNRFHSSIAIGDYAVDLHGCNDESTLEGELEHEGDRPPGFRMGGFQIPLETLIPEKVDGLLAAEKNISQTRLANGATRLQPITILTGQAAGALAALAAADGTQPRRVAPVLVQKTLLEAGSTLAIASFTDVPRTDPLWAAIQLCVTHDWLVTPGKGLFQASEPITRGSAAVALARRAGLSGAFNVYRSANRDAAFFQDVPLYNLQSTEIEVLNDAGVLKDCGTNPVRFCPDTPMTRGEFQRVLAKLVGLPPAAPALTLNPDSAPDRALTRGDAALLLYRSAELPIALKR
jgi:hypothetical protein